ncbi:MAG: PIG-L deacetylase family protein [Acidimicrobiales bacterium]
MAGAGSVVFFHAHPDDEAIFTGGTIARLAAAHHRVVLVVATGGELGEPHEDALGPAHLAAVRRAETERAARLLGVARVESLGFHDSGMAGDPSNDAPGSFWSSDPDEAARRLADVLSAERADALVVYDADGIYGHPDHIQVHRVGHLAAVKAGVPTVYEATVDREYLHFVETHLVHEAILTGDLGLVRSHVGTPTVVVTNTIDVGGVLETKRAALAAHASQIPETASALLLPQDRFGAVYGWEWYVRHGPAGPIDDL